ncbi:isoprenoid synthase domain-containing protein [Crassisporium funariophilum]|nr:isoprenoid synthase domain-containing protein [Crassisporium funariophilum]
MRRVAVNPISQSLFARQVLPVTRCRCRKLSVLAQKIEHTTRTRPEHIPIHHEPQIRQRPDPYILVASETSHIRKNMLNLLGSAHPGLAAIAEYYFLHPSKQIRSLLVLLFSRATNGLGRHWERKHWDGTYERSSGLSVQLDKPLTLSDALNEWNPSMPDHTASFESVFDVQRTSPRLTQPAPPSSSRNPLIPPSLASPPTLLPTQIRLAQIIEMVHVASLLHDNITSSSDIAQTACKSQNDTFGNKLSILGGDFLLGRASTALSRLGESEVVELVASVISNLVEGEILRMDEVKTPELGLLKGPATLQAAWDLYLQKTYLKTASLMAKGARAAVILGGCREGDLWKEVAYVYGRNLGIAYQLLEDVNDYKSLQPGLATGPVLFAAEECPRLLPLIQRNFSQPGDTELAMEHVQSTSGVERTHLLADAYASKAREVLHLLPDSDARQALETLTEVVVKRTR